MSKPDQKFKVGQKVKVRDSHWTGKVSDITWMLYPKTQEYCWGYYIELDASAHPVTYSYVAEQFLDSLE